MSFSDANTERVTLVLMVSPEVAVELDRMMQIVRKNNEVFDSKEAGGEIEFVGLPRLMVTTSNLVYFKHEETREREP
jgi:hypothetical protein